MTPVDHADSLYINILFNFIASTLSPIFSSYLHSYSEVTRYSSRLVQLSPVSLFPNFLAAALDKAEA